MRKICLSILGTSDYQETAYRYDNALVRTRYFQEALKQFFPDYDLFVLMTQQSAARHETSLQAACDFHKIEIPRGANELELWQLFSSIADAIPNDSSLIVDITHGYRSLPLLLLAACQFLSKSKNVRVERILYGAFEGRDSADETPVIDLRSFLELLNWTTNAELFWQYGQAVPLGEQLRELQNRSYRDKQDYRAKGLTNLASRLSAVHGALTMVRPQEVLAQSQKTPAALEKAREDIQNLPQAQPLALLFDKIEDALDVYVTDGELFSPQGFRAQLAMLRHYLRTEQYQPAVTLARELLVSWQCYQESKDMIVGRKSAEDNLNGLAKQLANNEVLEPSWHELAQLWGQLANLRNDINHAGMRVDTLTTDAAVKQATSYCNRVIAWLESELNA